MPDAAPSRARTIVVVAFGVLLLLVVKLHLLAALVAGLGAYAIYEAAQRHLCRWLRPGWARAASLAVTVVVLALLGWGIVQAFEQLRGAEGLARLMRLLADTVDRLRVFMPKDMADSMPSTAEEMQRVLSHWLREHAKEVQHWGGEALHLLVDLLVGSAIGVLVAFSPHTPARSRWQALWRERLHVLSDGFNNVVAAQVRIAALNAVLTGIFLMGALPLAGYPLPFARTLVVFTFGMGLVPIVGNLISNVAIMMVGLSVSPAIGVACLVFLVVIHKLEYFLNAHFVGNRTAMAPYVVLAAMLLGEAAFGPAGLLAAPIYGAWLSRELQDAELV